MIYTRKLHGSVKCIICRSNSNKWIAMNALHSNAIKGLKPYNSKSGDLEFRCLVIKNEPYFYMTGVELRTENT